MIAISVERSYDAGGIGVFFGESYVSASGFGESTYAFFKDVLVDGQQTADGSLVWDIVIQGIVPLTLKGRPMTMLKAQCDHRGAVPQDVIHAVPLASPPPAAGQALVATVASPINPSDVLTLTGHYGALPPLPAVGGTEGVGRIAAVGEGVTGLSVGGLVLPPPGSGTWVTHVLTDARSLVPLPEGADPLQLAMLTVNPPTASLMLGDFVPLSAGDWVIQNVANSGVGGYLIQLAKRRGLRTVNLVRRESAGGGWRSTRGSSGRVGRTRTGCGGGES